jgi:hypothetical protein
VGKKSTKGAGRVPPKREQNPVIAGRVSESLHQKIKQAAKRSGASMSDELARLAGLALQWEAALGSPELHRIAILMAATFAHAGKISAGGKPANEWVNDPTAYEAAVVATMKALLIGLPNATSDDVALLFERLRSRVAGEFLNRQSAESGQ